MIIIESTGGNQGATKRDYSKNTITSGEGFDMHFVELPKSQKELFLSVKELGKPIILILYGGRPHAITEELDDCAAVFQAFGAGEQGNDVLADMITGEVIPSGKLSISFPRSTGHIPCYYNYKPSARGRLYKNPGSDIFINSKMKKEIAYGEYEVMVGDLKQNIILKK